MAGRGKGKGWSLGESVRQGGFTLVRNAHDITVRELGGDWAVVIPDTGMMYAQLVHLRERGEYGAMGLLLVNMYAVSGIPNGYYQKAVSVLTGVVASPGDLRDGREEMGAFFAGLADDFLGWWEAERARAAAGEDAEADRRDALADDAVGVVTDSGHG